MSENTDPSLTPWVSPSVCPNCATTITGPFCASCGQAQKNINRSIWAVVAELFDDMFQFDSRVSHTLQVLLFKPGRITAEYLAGKRMRYIPPVRLYLIISFLFFVILPFLGLSHTPSEAEDAPLVENLSSEQIEDEGAKPEETSHPIIDLGFLTPEENEVLARTLEEQFRKAMTLYEEAPEEASSRLLELISVMMFFLLPVFAGCLKIFYLGKNRYYAEHLLLAVHNHCFLFIVFSVRELLGLAQGSVFAFAADFAHYLTYLWMVIYFYLGLKHVYQQSHLVTTIKFILLSFSYMALAVFGILVAMLVGIMSL